MYNLVRSREDKVRPKKDEFPFNQLGEDDLNALEEFYEKLPAESRPAKNGEVDPGGPELAEKLRTWCVFHSSSASPKPSMSAAAGSPVVSHLAKCAATGTKRTKELVAVSLKMLCTAQA